MKNWSDLPAELKLECIRKMKTKERWFLRQTAHTERELVDGEKLHLETVELTDSAFRIKNGGDYVDFRFYGKKQVNKDDCLPFIVFVLLKLMADMIMIKIKSEPFARQITDQLPLSNVFEAHRFLTAYDGFPWLGRLKKAEKISYVSGFAEEIPVIQKHYGYECVSNASFYQLQRVSSFQPLRELIEKWIEHPPKMGTELQIGFSMKIGKTEFASLHPESPVVEDRDLEEIRIETNAAAKGIIVYRIKGMLHFVCIIIPAKLKSSEKISRWTHIELC